jgi:hypothetical protein
MGRLRDKDGTEWPLLPVTLVGRGTSASIRIEAPYVSTEHASVRWTGEGWEVRDLASRNGTFVDGHRIESGQRARLPAGSTLAFGRTTASWTLVDGAAPPASASCEADQRLAEEDLLLLPDAESPEVCVYADERGWVAERGATVLRVADGASVEAGGRSWRLNLPTGLLVTRAAEEPDPDAASIALTFHVSRDEEHIEITVAAGARTWRLPHRAHAYLLLTLARARLDADPELSESEQGWLYHDELAEGLGLPMGHFNMAVFRIRQQLKDAGVPGGDALLERRRGSGQIRLGCARVEVEAL